MFKVFLMLMFVLHLRLPFVIRWFLKHIVVFGSQENYLEVLGTYQFQIKLGAE